MERQKVARRPTFLGLTVGKETVVAEVLVCSVCSGVFGADEIGGSEPTDDVEHLATRIGVVAMLQSGRPNDGSARSVAVLAVRETTSLAYDLEALDLDLTMAPADRLGAFLEPAASFPAAVRERILARLISVAVAGGMEPAQRQVLAQVAQALGLDADTCKAVVARTQIAGTPAPGAPLAAPAEAVPWGSLVGNAGAPSAEVGFGLGGFEPEPAGFAGFGSGAAVTAGDSSAGGLSGLLGGDPWASAPAMAASSAAPVAVAVAPTIAPTPAPSPAPVASADDAFGLLVAAPPVSVGSSAWFNAPGPAAAPSAPVAATSPTVGVGDGDSVNRGLMEMAWLGADLSGTGSIPVASPAFTLPLAAAAPAAPTPPAPVWTAGPSGSFAPAAPPSPAPFAPTTAFTAAESGFGSMPPMPPRYASADPEPPLLSPVFASLATSPAPEALAPAPVAAVAPPLAAPVAAPPIAAASLAAPIAAPPVVAPSGFAPSGFAPPAFAPPPAPSPLAPTPPPMLASSPVAPAAAVVAPAVVAPAAVVPASGRQPTLPQRPAPFAGFTEGPSPWGAP